MSTRKDIRRTKMLANIVGQLKKEGKLADIRKNEKHIFLNETR